MLREQNDKLLRQKGVKEQVIPFYQIWQELVNEKTLDIYQYRILTSLSALEELAEVLRKTIAGIFTNDANIESCREETLYLLNSDVILEKYYKAIANRLRFSLGQRPKSDADKVRLHALVKYAVIEITPKYEWYAVEELRLSILAGDLKEISVYANIVAGQAVHNGWSSQALNDLLRFFRDDKTFDVYSAAHKAIRKISDLLNMASFYNLVSAWDLSSVSLVVVNNINKYHKAFNAEQLYRTYDYLDSSGKVFEYTKSIFMDDNKIALREKLTGAFGYANISRASLFQEEKYMNLWVALESLARTRMYPDIISNVKQTVPAAMSLIYIQNSA